MTPPSQPPTPDVPQRVEGDFEPFSERHLHHIWCNFYHRPRAGCRMCDDFFARFPDDSDPDALMAEHYPNVTVLK